MSPAPQGGLQVERFIGSCLISAHHRGKNHNHHSSPRSYLPPSYHHPLPPPQPHHHPSWTGAPLFCVANRKTARKGGGGGGGGGFTRYQNNNKANDHVIVDEARSPLSRLAIHTQGAPLIQAERYNRHRNAPPPFRLYRGGNSTAVDAASRSDDLPPKSPPAGAGACDSVSVASDESSTNSENSLPRIIKPRKRRKKDRKPPVTSTQQEEVPDVVVAVEQEEKPAPSKDEKVVEVKSVGDDDDVLPPGLDQDQDDVPATSCQCSYCDPVGVIWDADQRCYSPFLTPPPTPFLDSLALRRSWSEPSPPPATAPRTRTHSEPAPAPGGLEVSSQIITSPNGHRDIEIKFFSSRGPRAFVAEE